MNPFHVFARKLDAMVAAVPSRAAFFIALVAAMTTLRCPGMVSEKMEDRNLRI